MDNAAKALIMTGAVFLALAIVGIGIYIFSTTGAFRDSAAGQMDSDAINRLNTSLRQYAGNGVRGAAVSQAIEYVAIANTNNTFPIKIEISYGGNKTDDPATMRGFSIDSGKMYNISVSDSKGNDGAYDLLTISE